MNSSTAPLSTMPAPQASFSQTLQRLAVDVQGLGIFVGGLAVLFLGPFMLARFILEFTLKYLPLLVQIIVLVIFFAILLFWAWLISGPRRSEILRGLYAHGVKWPTLFSSALLLFSLPCFAALTAVLASHGRIKLESPVPHVTESIAPLQDFYLWHFCDAVPAIDINKTLKWESPYVYKDRLSGFLVLVFKLFVILPVIGSFVAWKEICKDQKKADTETP